MLFCKGLRCSSRTAMFAPRFDPDAEIVDKTKPISLIRKQKLSIHSVSPAENEFSSESSECTSDSDSDSNSSESRKGEDEGEEKSLDRRGNFTDASTSEIIKKDEQSSERSSDAQRVDVDDDYVSRHSKIFAKFHNMRAMDAVDSGEMETENIETQALAPMPQPTLPVDGDLSATLTYLKNLEWLAKPTYSLPDVQRPFSDFPLSASISKNLNRLGFINAFSVQIVLLDLLLKDLERGRLSPDFRGDVLVNSSTGSGKTLAYSIPIVQALEDRIVPRVRAIVLVPTRPLINQVAFILRDIAQGTTLQVASLTNELSVKDEETRLKANVPDIIVSAPGRLVDHLLRGVLSLEALRFLVIDEADRLLDQTFQSWCLVVISNIEKWLPSLENLANTWKAAPQKIVLSATLTTDAGKLSLLKLTKPRLVIVNSIDKPLREMFSLPATLKEYKMSFTTANSANKPLLLAKFLLESNKLDSVLVFAKSNDATLRLSKVLNDLLVKLIPRKKMVVAYMNSTNNIPAVRGRILRDFDQKTINVLVATDLIARGIDITSISCVFNYDLPNSSREYVHRVGRTARANSVGEAYAMCFGGVESKRFDALMEDIGRIGAIEEAQLPALYEDEIEIYDKVMKEFLLAL